MKLMLLFAVAALADTDLFVKDKDGSYHKLTDTEATRNLEPERYAPFACAKMVGAYRDAVLLAVSKGESVHCEMSSYGPLIRFTRDHGESRVGCPYAIFGNLRQKCDPVHGKVPAWAKEKP